MKKLQWMKTFTRTFLFAAGLALHAGLALAGGVTLAWDAVTLREDGSPLKDLGGYRLYRSTNVLLDRTTDQATLDASVRFPIFFHFQWTRKTTDQAALDASVTMTDLPGPSTSTVVGGLVSGTTYYFRLTALDAAGLQSGFNVDGAGKDIQVVLYIPLSDMIPPTVSITSPAAGATASGVVTVSATAADNVGVVGVQFRLDGASLGAEMRAPPYAVAWDTTLASDGPHVLTAVARDAAGNTGVSPPVAVKVDDTAPVISGVGSTDITTSGATIVWMTDKPADSQVKYGLSTSYGQTTTLNGSWVTSHGVSLSGLSAGTLYHYRVRSRDGAGNLAVSGDFTFLTQKPADVTPPKVELVSPSDGANVYRDVTVRVAGSDDVAVQRVELWTDGSPAESQAFNPPVPSFATSLNWSAPSQGDHTLQARAVDTSGNVGVSAVVTVHVVRRSVSMRSSDGSGGQFVADEARALVVNFKRAMTQELLFGPEVCRARIVDGRGRVLMEASDPGRGGAGFALPLQGAVDRGLKMESGLLIVEVTGCDGSRSAVSLIVAK